MKKELFDEFLESVREGGAIMRGKKMPSRTFQVSDPDVRGIRQQYALSQEKFASLIGISVATLRKLGARPAQTERRGQNPAPGRSEASGSCP